MPTISHCYLKNVLYTGTYDGRVCVWGGEGGRSIKDPENNIKQCHTGPVYCMFGRANQTGFITGGKGGLVIKWSTYGGGMVNETQYDLKSKEAKSLNPRVKSVCEHP